MTITELAAELVEAVVDYFAPDVVITGHCRDRLRERCPGLRFADAHAEVLAALAAGRASEQRPDWLGPTRGDAAGRNQALFVWTPERERTYVLVADGRGWAATTVLTPERLDVWAKLERIEWAS